jgi:peroxiredoxin
MKKGLIVFIVTGLIACGKKENSNFLVEGVIKNSGAKMIYLEENAANQSPMIIDSFQLKGDKFTLTGSGRQQSIYSLRTDQSLLPFAILINDSKKIEINADLKNAIEPYSVNGSDASQGIIDYDRNSATIAQRIFTYSREVDSLMKLKSPDSVINLPFGRYENEVASLKSYTNEFIGQSKSPVLALYALGNYQRLSQQLGTSGMSETEVQQVVNQLAKEFNEHTALQELNRSMKPKLAPDFSLPDTSGKTVALSSFKGKYLLVDFWASWCVPCRQENPNVVKAFEKYKDKNFTILGVSLDKSREAWVQAIKADNLGWTHISDLKYWNSAAAELYKVRSIPYNILLDPEGRIIAENVMGEELVKALSTYIK